MRRTIILVGFEADWYNPEERAHDFSVNEKGWDPGN